MIKLSWKIVFNTNLHHWNWVGYAMKAAENAGYEYLVWNGRVHHTSTGADTGFLEETLK